MAVLDPTHRDQQLFAPSTVLFVEDDALLRVTTAECLRDHGYRIIEAAKRDRRGHGAWCRAAGRSVVQRYPTV